MIRHARRTLAKPAARRFLARSPLLALAVTLPSLSIAQESRPPAPPDFSFLAAVGAPSGEEIASVERGDVVVREVRTAERDEVALLGIVGIAAPRELYLERARDVSVSLPQPGRQSYAVVRTPATESDFAALTLDASEASGLQKCQVTHCSLKLPKEQMAAMAGAVDWSRDGASQRAARLDSLMRRWLAELVNAYRTRGDAALPVYDDTRADEHSAVGFRQLLAEDAFLLREAPSLATHLAESPERTPAGVSSIIYWAADRRPGLKPIVSVSQLSTFRAAGERAPMLVAVKQLYASHYFDAWLDVSTLLESSSASSSPQTYLVVMRRIRFDKLPSRALFDVRGRIVRRLRDAMHEELGRAKEMTEAAQRAP